MKKAISLLLVLAVALSLSSIAFAATDIPGTDTTTIGNYASISPRAIAIPLATSGATQYYDIAAGELFLVSNNIIVGTDTVLRPDETYKFDIHYAAASITNANTATILASTKKLQKSDIGNGTVRVRTMKGSSAVQSSKIITVGSKTTNQTYQLEVVTRANYGTKTTDVEYILSIINSNTTNTFVESTNTFTVGFGEYSDSTDIGEDGIVTISNDNPVITKDQFTEMAKSANYRNIIFEAEDGNWIYKGKIAGMKDTNFSYNYDPDTDLLNKFPDQEFKFLTFPGGVHFPTTGEMRINVSDVSSDFKTMYAYLYRDGRLTEIDATYDSGADELIFRTNYLGEFVITNMAITDTSLVAEEEPENVEEEEEEEEYYPNNLNPGTGAGSSGAMMLFGLMTLASAAVVSKKRR
jgi:hypothetical protein